jgi:branched-subunit amino acid ABC-type transport system permease component
MIRNRTITFAIICACFVSAAISGAGSALGQPVDGKKVGDASLVPKVRFTKEQFDKLVYNMALVALLL